MATILAHIKIFAGKEAEFEKTLKALVEATHRNEPNCRRYEYWRGAEERLYYCLLSFDDYRSFMIHQTSPHHEAPDFPAFIEGMKLEWVDPVQGGSDLVPTEPQDLPPDASDLMKQYAQMQPVEKQAWWEPLRKA